VTVYLLDENVLRELHPDGHPAVLAWYATVAESDLRISVMTLFEKRRGWERRRRASPEVAATRLAQLDALEATYGDRIVPIDRAVTAEWARLLGAKDKNQRDRALAATARVQGFVLVTRNVDDVRGCDVPVLNPFEAGSSIKRVSTAASLFDWQEPYRSRRPNLSALSFLRTVWRKPIQQCAEGGPNKVPAWGYQKIRNYPRTDEP